MTAGRRSPDGRIHAGCNGQQAACENFFVRGRIKVEVTKQALTPTIILLDFVKESIFMPHYSIFELLKFETKGIAINVTFLQDGVERKVLTQHFMVYLIVLFFHNS